MHTIATRNAERYQKSTEGFRQRRWAQLLLAGRGAYVIWGALVALLVIVLEVAYHANNPQPITSIDTGSFIYTAHDIMDLGKFVNAWRVPGYPTIMALVFWITGRDNFAALYLTQQALFVLSTLELFAVVALMFRRPVVAGVVALMFGLDLYPLEYANLLIAEGLSLFLVLAVALCVVIFLRTPSRWTLWIVAAVTLLLSLTRAEWVFAPVPLFAYLAWMVQRRGMLRDMLPHFALTLLALYAAIGGYAWVNGVQNGYYGISAAQNPNLLGKVLQYHMSGASDQFAATDSIVGGYEAKGGWEPFILGQQDPELTTDNFALSSAYATSVIERHPAEFAADTIPLIYNPQGIFFDYKFIQPEHPFTRSLTFLQSIAGYLEGLLLYAPLFALLWGAFLFWRPTARLFAVEATGAIVVLVMFDRVLTVVGSYSDYIRLQSPISGLETMLTLGSVVLLVPLLADTLARARVEVPATLPVAASSKLTDRASIAIQPAQRQGTTTIQNQGESAGKSVVIMGAGPAGLTAAYELRRYEVPVTVVEKDPTFVGGISRTVEHRGYRFDIGGHRFFSKSQEVEDLWTEILGSELLICGRLSRIYYQGKYFDYPLKATNALLNMGLIETVRCMSSYAWARIHPVRDPQNFEDLVSNQFGRRLFSIFFKTYTEKVWGISTKELSADWAAQRIKGLDLGQAIKSALLPHRSKGKQGAGKAGTGRKAVITTLIDEFRYPRLGPGQMWEHVARILYRQGQPLLMGQEVAAIRHANGRVNSILVRDAQGVVQEVTGTDFLSTLPIRELIDKCEPALPEHVRQAADSLKYRDFLTVAVVVNKAQMFPDNWIYIHDPTAVVGRIQNFKNWSPDMVPDQNTTCLGLEYFCFEGDGLWSSTDEELVGLARRELVQLGMCRAEDVAWGVVVRQPKAYPVYDDVYKQHLAIIRDYLQAELPNLQLVGRNGMHHYNNQDHSMMTALLVARNIATGTTYDPWKVNTDAEYHEEARIEDGDASGRLVPERVPALAHIEK